MTTDRRDEIIAGLRAAIRDPECPVQYSPLLIAARKALEEPEFDRGVTHTVDLLANALKVTDWVAGDGWQDIGTAPKMKNIILFAVTDIADDGRVRNWKMDTGYWSTGVECWTWSGYQVSKRDIQPTHWRPCPEPPVIAEEHAG